MRAIDKKESVIGLEETESTNDYLKALIRSNKPQEGFVVTTEFQSAGRGQKNNSWSAERGANLLFSLVIYPHQIAIKDQFIISEIASVAVKRTLNRFVDDLFIKWPNDIYWKDKKISGMLIENALNGSIFDYSVIGIGLNINQKTFPENIPNPVSLSQITRQDYSKDEILAIFRSEFSKLYDEVKNGNGDSVELEYKKSLYRGSGYHWYEDENGRFKASIQDILPTGLLVLETLDEGDVREYNFKEIAYIDDEK